VRNYYNKPYNRRLFDYYLGQIVDVYGQDSVRIQTWLEEETNASGSYDANAGDFLSWFALREGPTRQEIASDYGTAFVVTTGDGTTTTTSDTTQTLQGSAPTTLFTVAVAQHPEATLTWTGKTQWLLAGIRLQEGANALEVTGLDADGQVIETLNFLVTKTGNAPLLERGHYR
jgi:hypothetical protein